MRVRCPHCHNPIEIVVDAELKDIACSNCGSSFSLVGDDSTKSYRPKTRKIAHFELIEQLGIGAFGTVWKAKDTQLDRIVSIKTPRVGQLDSDEAELFLREARAAAQLKHPNIVSVHEVGRDDGQLYIVSDFVQGANLKQWLSACRPTFREAAELCTKIASALHHAHEKGVIHRDVKPSNVMMDDRGEPHIMDFGLAKRDAGEVTMTMDGRVLGTPAYMSPEQAAGKSHTADGRADLYSVGVMLFELLTAELPFRGDKEMLLLQIRNEEPPSPRQLNRTIPRDLETICLKCLEKEPRLRYASCLALAADLTRFMNGEPTLARPIGPVRRFWKWYQHQTVTMAAASAIFTAAFIGLIVVGLVVAVVVARLATGTAKTFLLSESTLILNNFLLAILAALVPAYVAVRSGFAALQGKRRGLWGTALVIAFWNVCSLFQVITKFLMNMEGFNKVVGVHFAHSLLFDITSLLWLSICLAMQVYALLATRKVVT